MAVVPYTSWKDVTQEAYSKARSRYMNTSTKPNKGQVPTSYEDYVQNKEYYDKVLGFGGFWNVPAGRRIYASPKAEITSYGQVSGEHAIVSPAFFESSVKQYYSVGQAEKSAKARTEMLTQQKYESEAKQVIEGTKKIEELSAPARDIAFRELQRTQPVQTGYTYTIDGKSVSKAEYDKAVQQQKKFEATVRSIERGKAPPGWSVEYNIRGEPTIYTLSVDPDSPAAKRFEILTAKEELDKKYKGEEIVEWLEKPKKLEVELGKYFYGIGEAEAKGYEEWKKGSQELLPLDRGATPPGLEEGYGLVGGAISGVMKMIEPGAKVVGALSGHVFNVLEKKPVTLTKTEKEFAAGAEKWIESTEIGKAAYGATLKPLKSGIVGYETPEGGLKYTFTQHGFEEVGEFAGYFVVPYVGGKALKYARAKTAYAKPKTALQLAEFETFPSGDVRVRSQIISDIEVGDILSKGKTERALTTVDQVIFSEKTAKTYGVNRGVWSRTQAKRTKLGELDVLPETSSYGLPKEIRSIYEPVKAIPEKAGKVEGFDVRFEYEKMRAGLPSVDLAGEPFQFVSMAKQKTIELKPTTSKALSDYLTFPEAVEAMAREVKFGKRIGKSEFLELGAGETYTKYFDLTLDSKFAKKYGKPKWQIEGMTELGQLKQIPEVGTPSTLWSKTYPKPEVKVESLARKRRIIDEKYDLNLQAGEQSSFIQTVRSGFSEYGKKLEKFGESFGVKVKEKFLFAGEEGFIRSKGKGVDVLTYVRPAEKFKPKKVKVRDFTDGKYKGEGGDWFRKIDLEDFIGDPEIARLYGPQIKGKARLLLKDKGRVKFSEFDRIVKEVLSKDKKALRTFEETHGFKKADPFVESYKKYKDAGRDFKPESQFVERYLESKKAKKTFKPDDPFVDSYKKFKKKGRDFKPESQFVEKWIEGKQAITIQVVKKPKPLKPVQKKKVAAVTQSTLAKTIQKQASKTKTKYKTELSRGKTSYKKVSMGSGMVGLMKEKVKTKSKVKGITQAKVKTVLKPKTIEMQRIKTKTLAAVSLKDLEKERQKMMEKERTTEREMMKEMGMERVMELEKEMERMKEAERFKDLERVAELELELEKTAELQRETELTKTIQRQARVARTIPPTPKRIKGGIVPPPLPPFKPEKAVYSTAKMGKGFDVFLKTRPVAGEKKSGKQKLVKLNKRPLTQKSALSLGAETADKFVEKTFVLKPSKKKVSSKSPKHFGWEFLKVKFRPKIRKGKAVSPNTYVEKSKYAIDSTSEKLGIPYKGQRALRRSPKLRLPKRKRGLF